MSRTWIWIALHWEHRSFKEQGIDREPTIHIGAVANALERKGIQTERGNINREIIKNNLLLEQAKEMLISCSACQLSADLSFYQSLVSFRRSRQGHKSSFVLLPIPHFQ